MVFVRKGTFIILGLQDISFFNVTSDRALPFLGLSSAESTLTVQAQNHPQEKEMQKCKMVVWGGLTNSWEKKWKAKEKRKWKWNVKVSHVQLFWEPMDCPWNSPGQNTVVGSLSFLQGLFPSQGLNPGLLHCKWILYQLSHKGSPSECRQNMSWST